MVPCRPFAVLGALSLLMGCAATPGADPLTAEYPDGQCTSCVEWNEPAQPVQIFGNTYYVGTSGLTSVLITSPEGHVLIDGALPNSAPLILDNVRALGFEVSDIALILNSHTHFDHAGGIAALQRATGARVAASVPSAPVLEAGRSGPDDPQFGILLDFPPVAAVERFADGETLRVGPLALTGHLTAGHTPGGTTWSWRSCEAQRCLDMVYGDSQSSISADDFRFTDSETYPTAIADFERGFAVLETVPCDILITPHPAASSLWERLSAGTDGLVDPDACRRYAANARAQLMRRIEAETANQ